MRIDLFVQAIPLIVQVFLKARHLGRFRCDIGRGSIDCFTELLQRLLISRSREVLAKSFHIGESRTNNRGRRFGVGRVEHHFKLVAGLNLQGLHIVIQLLDVLVEGSCFAFQFGDLGRAVGVLAVEHVGRDPQDHRQHHEDDECVVNGTRLVGGGGHGEFLRTET